MLFSRTRSGSSGRSASIAVSARRAHFSVRPSCGGRAPRQHGAVTSAARATCWCQPGVRSGGVHPAPIQLRLAAIAVCPLAAPKGHEGLREVARTTTEGGCRESLSKEPHPSHARDLLHRWRRVVALLVLALLFWGCAGDPSSARKTPKHRRRRPSTAPTSFGIAIPRRASTRCWWARGAIGASSGHLVDLTGVPPRRRTATRPSVEHHAVQLPRGDPGRHRGRWPGRCRLGHSTILEEVREAGERGGRCCARGCTLAKDRCRRRPGRRCGDAIIEASRSACHRESQARSTHRGGGPPATCHHCPPV